MGNEFEWRVTDHARPPVTMEMAERFEARGQYGMAEIARKYAVDRPRWWHRFRGRPKDSANKG